MIHGLWNYAIKALDIEKIIDFYVQHLGAQLRLSGEVFGCQYVFRRLGDTRLLIFDRAPYEEQHNMNLPQGSYISSTKLTILRNISRCCEKQMWNGSWNHKKLN